MASLAKDSRSPFYWARFRDASGREFTRSTRERDRDKALLVAQQMESLAREGTSPEKPAPFELVVLPNPDSIEPAHLSNTLPSITSELEHFLESQSHLTKDDHERYEHAVREFISFLGQDISALPLRALSHEQLSAYQLLRRQKNIPEKQLAFELQILRDVCQIAFESGRVPKNIVEEISSSPTEKHAVKSFSVDQIRALLRACDDFRRGDDWRGVIAVAFSLGGLLHDIANLRFRDVSFERDQHTLRFPSVTPSPAPNAPHQLHPLLSEYLLLRGVGMNLSSFIFPALADRQLGGEDGLAAEFGHLMAIAGIERQTPGDILPDGVRLIYEYSERSLEQVLASEHAEAILSSAFRIHLSRRQYGALERRQTQPQPSQQQASYPQPPPMQSYMAPRVQTRTI